MPKTASFCPSCGASTTPVEMLGFEYNAPIDTREITFGAANEGRSRRGLAVGGLVTALVIGGIVAVSGSNKNSASAPTTAAPTSTTSSTAPDSTTSSTVPEPTTTTSFPVPVAVNAAAPLLGEMTGLELWFQARFEAVGGAASPSGVYRVDLDKGIAEHVAPTTYNNGPVFAATVDGDGYHVIGESSMTVRRDGTQARGRGMNVGVLSTDPEGFWVQNYDYVTEGPVNAPRIERRRLDGTVATTTQVPAGAYVRSGAGPHTLVLATADGRSFLFDTDAGTTLPVSGSVIAANGGAMVVVRCSDALICSAVYIAADGSEHPVDVSLSAVDSGIGSVTLSPDGAWILRTAFPTFEQVNRIGGDDVGNIVVSNPLTGESVDLGTVSFDQTQQYGNARSTGWTPDGRWLLFATQTGIHAWRPGLERPILISVGNGVMHAEALAIGKSPAAAAP
jgi:WD40-like Beta Propeller Repeat